MLSIQTSLSSFPLFPPFSSATGLFFAKDCGRWCRISRAREISRKNNGKRLRGRKGEAERRIRHEDDCGFSGLESGVAPYALRSSRPNIPGKSFVRRNRLSGGKQGRVDRGRLELKLPFHFTRNDRLGISCYSSSS